MLTPPDTVVHQPGFNLYADHGDKTLGTMIALIVLASTFVILRLTSRHLTRVGFWVSDTLFTYRRNNGLNNNFNCSGMMSWWYYHWYDSDLTPLNQQCHHLIITYSFLP